MYPEDYELNYYIMHVKCKIIRSIKWSAPDMLFKIRGTFQSLVNVVAVEYLHSIPCWYQALIAISAAFSARGACGFQARNRVCNKLSIVERVNKNTRANRQIEAYQIKIQVAGNIEERRNFRLKFFRNEARGMCVSFPKCVVGKKIVQRKWFPLCAL